MYFLIDKTRRIVFGWSAKCGCTHIKKIFWYLTNNIENHPGHCEEAINDLPQDIENYTVILIVRNPFERLVSGFLDKYKPNGEYRKSWPSNKITFKGFVDVLIKNEFKEVNRHHFTPQTTEKFDSKALSKSKKIVVYDLKNINYSFIEGLYNKKIPTHLINFRGNHTNNKVTPLEKDVYSLEMSEYIDFKVDTKNFYNNELKDKVFKFYEKDFAYFNLFNINY